MAVISFVKKRADNKPALFLNLLDALPEFYIQRHNN
jgi:hypothetical protein